MENTEPHMPTHFKNTVEKYGPIKPLPQTLNPEEDLKQVLCSEASEELIIEGKMRAEKQKRNTGLQQSPIKEVPKYLTLDIVDEDVKLIMFMLPKCFPC